LRRLTKIAAASAVLALTLTACGSNGEEEETNTGASEDVCSDASGDGPMIGLAYDVGGRGDQSFNDSAYVGLTKAVDELDATCREVEAGSGENDADREERLRLLADEGFNPVIAVGFIYSPAVATVAPEYPETDFAVIDGYASSIQEADNVADLTFAEHEGSFLVGVAAALKTEADTVGFVGGVNGPLIQKFEAGFKAGVEAVDPNIEVLTQYLSQDDPQQGFENPAGGETAATGMFDNGADIVYHAAGKSGLGVFDAVEAAGEGNWAIGVDSDQYLTVDEAQQPFILTSMLKRIDTAVFEYVEAFEGGDAGSGFVTYNLESGGVDYSTSGGFVSDITDDIDEYRDPIVSGEITVPETP
jgi:basic membrane protein A and related proteins